MDNNLLIPLDPEAVAVMGNLESRLYSVAQASKILGLPTTWIYERTRKDAIPFHKLGKYIRFTPSDLAAILAKCSRGPKNDAAITQ
ncbi:MAG: helix-turn-helix domain-containing protein [Acidobacteria bacterium]|nr:helix-turn-helix domain-containing protein [Acidobacteriota bacterium]MCI0719082.1 helix-turn-helix domain-containing protein [Acidobacteriota bacterium]